MVRMLSCIAVFLMLEISFSRAQTVLPDSIENRYHKQPRDSNFVVLMVREGDRYLKTKPALSRQMGMYASELSRSLNYRRGYARSLTLVGNSYWYEGIYGYAHNYYLLAARQYQSIGDRYGLGKVYNNIGEVNKKMENRKEALNYLVRSVNLRPGDTTLALTLFNIAELYLQENNFSEALSYTEKSMKLAVLYSDQRSINYNNWSMAKIKLASGKTREGIAYYNKAIEGWKESNDSRPLIQAYHELAEIHLATNRFGGAEFYIHEAHRLSKRINSADLLAEGMLLQSRLYAANGNSGKAYEYLVQHNILQDSIEELSKTEQIARIQTLYETEQRDRENEQLRADQVLKDQKLKSREGLIAAISTSLLLLSILIAMLVRQRSKIMHTNQVLKSKNEEINFQKEAIEVQAVALLKLNEELQDLNKTLEQRIDERSKQLIVQNRKLAEYSFVNAHKLRAPVASILGLIQLMPQVEDHERELILKHLKTCSEQLDSIIQEISRNLES